MNHHYFILFKFVVIFFSVRICAYYEEQEQIINNETSIVDVSIGDTSCNASAIVVHNAVGQSFTLLPGYNYNITNIKIYIGPNPNFATTFNVKLYSGNSPSSSILIISNSVTIGCSSSTCYPTGTPQDSYGLVQFNFTSNGTNNNILTPGSYFWELILLSSTSYPGATTLCGNIYSGGNAWQILGGGLIMSESGKNIPFILNGYFIDISSTINSSSSSLFSTTSSSTISTTTSSFGIQTPSSPTTTLGQTTNPSSSGNITTTDFTNYSSSSIIGSTTTTTTNNQVSTTIDIVSTTSSKSIPTSSSPFYLPAPFTQSTTANTNQDSSPGSSPSPDIISTQSLKNETTNGRGGEVSSSTFSPISIIISIIFVIIIIILIVLWRRGILGQYLCHRKNKFENSGGVVESVSIEIDSSNNQNGKKDEEEEKEEVLPDPFV